MDWYTTKPDARWRQGMLKSTAINELEELQNDLPYAHGDDLDNTK